MNLTQFLILKDFKITTIKNDLKGVMLSSDKPRTLLYGENEDGSLVHVYLDDKSVIHKVVVASDTAAEIISHEDETKLTKASYAPSAIAYPELCDWEFCMKLAERGVTIPLVAFDEMVKGSINFRKHEEENA